MTLGEKVAMLRKESGMSQLELAKKLNTTQQTIGKYEHDIVTNLPLSRVIQLAEALGCDPRYLTGWTEDEEEQLPTIGELSSEESELIKLFRKVPEADRKKVLGMIQVALGNL